MQSSPPRGMVRDWGWHESGRAGDAAGDAGAKSTPTGWSRHPRVRSRVPRARRWGGRGISRAGARRRPPSRAPRSARRASFHRNPLPPRAAPRRERPRRPTRSTAAVLTRLPQQVIPASSKPDPSFRHTDQFFSDSGGSGIRTHAAAHFSRLGHPSSKNVVGTEGIEPSWHVKYGGSTVHPVSIAVYVPQNGGG